MLANCSLCGAEATLSFSANLVSSSFFAETWTILQALCCFRQHQQVCHFSFHVPLSDSCSVLAACPLLHLSFHLNLSGRTGLFFPPVLSDNSGSPELARRGPLLMPSAIPCSLSPLISCINSSLFLGMEAYCLIEILRHTGSFDFHRETFAPSSRSLCSFPSSLQRTQPTVKLLSF